MEHKHNATISNVPRATLSELMLLHTKLVGYLFIWLKGLSRQYFSLYRAISQRERGKKKRKIINKCQNNPTCTYCERSRPMNYYYPNKQDSIPSTIAPAYHPYWTPELELCTGDTSIDNNSTGKKGRKHSPRKNLHFQANSSTVDLAGKLLCCMAMAYCACSRCG